MRQTYDQFTERVMTNRAGKIKNIDDVARGRIFIARQAKDLGMVDELGGIEDAIQYAAGEAELKAGEYEVRTIPAPRTLADFFGGGGGRGAATDDASDAATHFLKPRIEISPDSILRLIAPSTRNLIGQQLQMAELLQRRPVLLMTPYVITVK
jgi:ClpP class serine protease